MLLYCALGNAGSHTKNYEVEKTKRVAGETTGEIAKEGSGGGSGGHFGVVKMGAE